MSDKCQFREPLLFWGTIGCLTTPTVSSHFATVATGSDFNPSWSTVGIIRGGGSLFARESPSAKLRCGSKVPVEYFALS